jgi:hypothetical protein
MRKQLCVQSLFHVTKILQREYNAKKEATTGSHIGMAAETTYSVAAGFLQILGRFRVRTCA